jgi:hypothetical protein
MVPQTRGHPNNWNQGFLVLWFPTWRIYFSYSSSPVVYSLIKSKFNSHRILRVYPKSPEGGRRVSARFLSPPSSCNPLSFSLSALSWEGPIFFRTGTPEMRIRQQVVVVVAVAVE